MFCRLAKYVGKLIEARNGSVAIQIGLGVVVLIGMVGLGTEGTFLIYKHRQMQAVADAAALSGATALLQSFPRDPVSEARAVAASLGFPHGSDQISVAVNVPPLSGAQAGNSGAVEVIISQPQDLRMMQFFGDQSANVGTRSVAMRSSLGQFCLLALDPSASQSMYLLNNAIIPDESCGVAVNSDSDTALNLKNNAVINGPVVTHGEWLLSNNAELNGTPLIQRGPVIDDPYADFEIGTVPPCTAQSGSGSNNLTRYMTPGRFCDGWNFKNNVTLNLASGTYFIDSKLVLKNNVVINATGGVTLVLNTSFGLDIKNNAILNIEAPTSGDYAGLALVSRRDATSSILQKFDNNVTLNVQGTLYFPNQPLEVDNNGVTDPNGCTHMIAREITLMNNVKVANNCDGTGVEPIGPPALLVE